MAATVYTMTASWDDLLIKSHGKDPHPLPLLANCLIALRMAPEWKDVLCWNEFTHVVQIRPGSRTPWGKTANHDWTDNDDRLTAEWLQQHGVQAKTTLASEAVLTVAAENGINPLIDFLNPLEWDGWPRLTMWLTDYLGVEETPYSRAVGRAWMISAVARAYQPGCKADHCLILEGKQGLKKSTALKALAGDALFSDSTVRDLGSKEAAILCDGVWIIEFAELEGIMSNPRGVQSVKAFISKTEDRYRPHYGKHAISVPRQCVFAATTNEDEYMHDTENRRFWPVHCTKARVEAIARDRTQLWAEAVHAYRDQDEEWWLPAHIEKQARMQQHDRLNADPWHDTIIEWACKRDDVSTEEILTICMKKDITTWTRAEQMRVAHILRSAGFVRYRMGGTGNRRWKL